MPKDKKTRILDGIHKSSSALSDDKVSIDTISETTTLIPELMSEKINNVPRTLKANEEITKDKPKANRLIFTGPYFGPYLVPFIGSFFGLHYHTSKLNQSSKMPKQRVNNGSRLTDDEKNGYKILIASHGLFLKELHLYLAEMAKSKESFAVTRSIENTAVT